MWKTGLNIGKIDGRWQQNSPKTKHYQRLWISRV